MVFDWFRRRTTPQAEIAAESAADTPADQAPGPDADLGAVAPEAEIEVVAAVVSEVAEPSAAPQDPPAEAATTPPAPAADPSGGVDQEALAWARQAYARLKAQQQAASPAPATAVAVPPSPVVSPSSPADQPAVVPELESGGPESVAAAEAIAAPKPPAASLGIEGSTPAAAAWSAVVAPTEPAAPTPVPLDGPAPAAPGKSLLEQAAAQRQKRLQELTAQESLAASEALAAPADRPAAAVTGASVPGTAVSATAGDDPQLGAFDDTFTWSAEVLAAQGRSVDQVSIEEIDWLGRLRRGLEKTRRGFVTQLLDTLGDDPLTPEVIDDLETTLLRADVGVQATDQVLAALRQRLNEEVVDPAEGLRFLKEQLRGLLEAP
ncbi:MAG: signal recognition particle receptor subunit alpha, partial [Cyanobacteriota bacterium]